MLVISYLYFLLCLRSIFSTIFICLVLRRFIRPHIPENPLSADKHLVIILKVFEETRLIEETITYIKRHTHNINNLKVIIVGSARERNSEGNNETLKLAASVIPRSAEYIIVEDPELNGSHAHQNNYALQFIKTPHDRTWIMTLDIDSKFSKRGLQAVVNEINSNTLVMQQSCLFLSNFPRLSVIQKGHAIYQSRWTIAHELKRILLHNHTFLSVAHVVGHGLCIRLDTLFFFGGFPEETMTEDIHLGYYIVAARLPIKSIPIFEIGDSPEHFRDGLRQEYVWSFGAMNYPQYHSVFRKRFPDIWKKNRFRCFIIMVESIISYVGWLTCSWLVASAIVAAMCGSIPALWFVMLYIFEFLLCAVAFLYFGLMTKSDFIMTPIYGLLGAVRRSLGADIAAAAVLLGQSPKKHKTPHY